MAKRTRFSLSSFLPPSPDCLVTRYGASVAPSTLIINRKLSTMDEWNLFKRCATTEERSLSSEKCDNDTTMEDKGRTASEKKGRKVDNGMGRGWRAEKRKEKSSPFLRGKIRERERACRDGRRRFLPLGVSVRASSWTLLYCIALVLVELVYPKGLLSNVEVSNVSSR